MNNNKSFLRKLAESIVKTSSYDKATNTLFVSNPAISFDTLKNLAKKCKFEIGQMSNGEYVSVPLQYKNVKFGQDDIYSSLYDTFIDTYTYYENNYSTLLTSYRTYDLMDENLAEVPLILDTYAAEVLAQGFITDPLNIQISDKKAEEKIFKILYRNNFFEKIPNITRSIAKYGNYGITLSYPCLENIIEPEDTKDINEIDPEKDLILNYINPKNFKVHVDKYNNPINYSTTSSVTYNNISKPGSVENKIWQPWQFVHILIPDEVTEPYGKSMLWSMRSPFDQLTILEAFLGISRASRIQRLVFYVPMPEGVSIVDSYGQLNEFKTKYINSIFTDTPSLRSGRKIPAATSILTLPVSADGKKVEVDHIESTIDLSSIEDVEYFLDKLLRNSKLEKGYLVGDDVITTAQTLEAQSLKLRRTLIPLKTALLNGVLRLIENIAAHCGYNVNKLSINVSLNEPIQLTADTIAKYKDICELLLLFKDVNPNLTEINKYQILVKFGIPLDIAELICSNSSLNKSDTPEDLAKFLAQQKIKIQSGELQPALDESIVTTKYKVSSRSIVDNRLEDLKELSSIVKDYNNRELKESVLKSKDDIVTNAIKDE